MLQYADDCGLVAHTPEALQAVLTSAIGAYSQIGSVNSSKTEVIFQWVSESSQKQKVILI